MPTTTAQQAVQQIERIQRVLELHWFDLLWIRMFHLCYLDVYFSLLAPLRTSEWMACECSTNSWGYGVVLISCDGSRRFVPLFSRKWGNCPKVCRNFNGAHIRRLVVAKSRNMWKLENNLSKEGQSPYIVVKNTQVFLYPFLRMRGGVVVQVSFKSVARFTIVRQMAPLYRAESALLWRMT